MNNLRRHNISKQAGGFTLLEIVFVLGMIAMLAVWLTVSVTTVDTEQQLREAVGSVEAMTKRCRSIAVMQQRPYQITIAAGSISMAPQYTRDEVIEEFGEADEDTVKEDFEDVLASDLTDSEVKYEIRRWRSDVWLEIVGEKTVALTVDPVGLVEPISIRCSKGASWIMQELHPLTGGVRNEEMSIGGE